MPQPQPTPPQRAPRQLPIIDIHTHVYPDPIAERAVQSVGDFYNVEMLGSGRLDDLIRAQERAGVAKSVIQSVAVKPQTVKTINDYMAKATAENPSVIGFAAMHQDFEDIEAEVERCLALGLKGFKVHPDTQGVNADDPRLMRLYGLIEGRLPLTIHAGDYRYDYSHPRRLVAILHEFPRLQMNTAHFGGWSIPDLAFEYFEHEHNFMDISSSMVYLGVRRTRELIEAYGAERMMFGSDFPMFDPATELGRLRACGLSARDLEQVTLRSAERFLGIDLA